MGRTCKCTRTCTIKHIFVEFKYLTEMTRKIRKNTHNKVFQQHHTEMTKNKQTNRIIPHLRILKRSSLRRPQTCSSGSSSSSGCQVPGPDIPGAFHLDRLASLADSLLVTSR